MYDQLEILRLSQSLARHAAARQGAIAGNVANADTPGYKARDVAPFAEAYRSGATGTAMHATRPGHLGGFGDANPLFDTIERAGPSAPNGNTVSLETEMLHATEVRHSHELALSVYQTSLGILRTSLGRGR